MDRKGESLLADKPDPIASRKDEVTVIDAKTDRPSASHATRVLVYVYALPRVLERHRGMSAGQVACPAHVVDIPADAVERIFFDNAGSLVRRLATQMPASACPARGEYQFSEVTSAGCRRCRQLRPP